MTSHKFSAMWQVAMAMIALTSGKSGDGCYSTEAARILGIFPTPSISHQMPLQTIMKALAARGHNVTVISPNPVQELLDNYSDIDLSLSYDTFQKHSGFSSVTDHDGSELMKRLWHVMHICIDQQLASPQFQDFRRNIKNLTFDLIIYEPYPAYFGLVHEVGSPPRINMFSMGALPIYYQTIGNPDNPAINPNNVNKYSDFMTFTQRVYNTYLKIWMYVYWTWDVYPKQEAIMRKYFGDGPPPISVIDYNVSMLIMNDHWTTDFPRALSPNVIQITGVHIKENPGFLPKELQQWMDAAKSDGGVLYFSLGSNVLSKDLPENKISEILRTFARLPLKVLWKWEKDVLPNCSTNVRTEKWVPQQAVLAHPNVRLFVTQGGLQSFQEAIFHSVPLLGIPFNGDQHKNVEKMVMTGVGRSLQFSELSEETLHHEVTTILGDNSYKDNMRRFSSVFREHKNSSLENALWWIEYVIRHRGAYHLRSRTLDLTWYQYALLDVVSFVLAVAVAIFFTVRLFIRVILRVIKRRVVRLTSTKENVMRKKQRSDRNVVPAGLEWLCCCPPGSTHPPYRPELDSVPPVPRPAFRPEFDAALHPGMHPCAVVGHQHGEGPLADLPVWQPKRRGIETPAMRRAAALKALRPFPEDYMSFSCYDALEHLYPNGIRPTSSACSCSIGEWRSRPHSYTVPLTATLSEALGMGSRAYLARQQPRPPVYRLRYLVAQGGLPLRSHGVFDWELFRRPRTQIDPPDLFESSSIVWHLMIMEEYWDRVRSLGPPPRLLWDGRRPPPPPCPRATPHPRAADPLRRRPLLPYMRLNAWEILQLVLIVVLLLWLWFGAPGLQGREGTRPGGGPSTPPRPRPPPPPPPPSPPSDGTMPSPEETRRHNERLKVANLAAASGLRLQRNWAGTCAPGQPPAGHPPPPPPPPPQSPPPSSSSPQEPSSCEKCISKTQGAVSISIYTDDVNTPKVVEYPKQQPRRKKRSADVPRRS